MAGNNPNDKKISELPQVSVIRNEQEYVVNDANTSKKITFQQIRNNINVETQILTGSGAPSSTPTFVGQTYIDTTGDRSYYAVGTASNADWRKNAKYDYGTVTVTAGGGDVTVNLDFDWTDGYLLLFRSGNINNYFNGGVNLAINMQTTFDAMTGAFTLEHLFFDNVVSPWNSTAQKTTNFAGLVKSVTSTSFTLDDDGATTVYMKWLIIA